MSPRASCPSRCSSSGTVKWTRGPSFRISSGTWAANRVGLCNNDRIVALRPFVSNISDRTASVVVHVALVAKNPGHETPGKPLFSAFQKKNLPAGLVHQPLVFDFQ